MPDPTFPNRPADRPDAPPRKRRPRILVLAEEKGTAETLLRGLAGLLDVDPEIELAFGPATAREQLRDVRYDLFVSERRHLDNGTSLVPAIPSGLPVVAIGGGASEDDRFETVPLPLSFTRLARAVEAALRPPAAGDAGEIGELRDLG